MPSEDVAATGVFLSLTIPAEYSMGSIFQWGIHQPTIDLTNKQWNIIYKEFIIVTEWEPVAICQFGIYAGI